MSYQPLDQTGLAGESLASVRHSHAASSSTNLQPNDNEIPRPSEDNGSFGTKAEHLAAAERRRYIYSAVALSVSLISFVIQTETAGYIANTLEYKKPIFMMYVTHSSWMSLWLFQILFLRVRKRKVPFDIFFRKHLQNVLSTAGQISSSKALAPQHHLLNSNAFSLSSYKQIIINLIKCCLILCIALNIAGSSWYIAVNLTTAGDLTAIYNCSAFFAYAFSVPLLHEQFRWDKAFSVILSIIGVVIVAYSGSTEDVTAASKDESEPYPYRAWGNIVIGAGAVVYGLYEVLYKRIACPPSTVSAKKQAAFANVVGSGIGVCTFTLLWPILPLLHFAGIEQFEFPRGEVLWVLVASVIANATFSGSFLILMSLTSPVLSSVASLLTTFIVAIVDWLLFGTPISRGGVIGGILIILAFFLLSYASWKELQGDDDEGEDDII
ncbi:hypothetical protein AWJ20_3434 [Sugiyamaella lignohabitans]|uniref:EamA domain-containing protein n=1 Tax=Sugiyamaella lignohabitans TaxID=796027 RepID=A0A161HHZ0_9ASCO|nr:uncharacterized protein AWJ20_3434 [Sugiyamaella lignohabitans]ANB15790.1 hypothetical protein AWJ20_3434 [Sugiyamaella lignohabitans]